MSNLTNTFVNFRSSQDPHSAILQLRLSGGPGGNFAILDKFICNLREIYLLFERNTRWTVNGSSEDPHAVILQLRLNGPGGRKNHQRAEVGNGDSSCTCLSINVAKGIMETARVNLKRKICF